MPRIIATLKGCLAGTLVASFAIISIARGAEAPATPPRKNTFIVDELWSQPSRPTQMNPFHEGVTVIQGLDQLVYSPLWEIDSVSHKQFPDLAATMPEAVSTSNTVFRFKVRTGLAWSDGVPFTADDVVFSINMLMHYEQLGISNYLRKIVKRVKVLDDNTIEIETNEPTQRLAQQLGVNIATSHFRIVPEHIWSKVNPVTYSNYPPVGIGPYKLDSVGKAGVVWRRRDDWQLSDVGKIVGKPAPEFVVFRTHQSQDAVIASLLKGEMDLATSMSPASLDTILAPGSKLGTWSKNFPWANMDDPCSKGIHFNTAKPPFDRADVRWALALALNLQEVSISAFSGMLRAGVLAVPPTAILTQRYYRPMLPWLHSFALADGYRPFDDSYAKRVSSALRRTGTQGVPADRAGSEAAFGIGWWRFDRKEASKLLLHAGFIKSGRQWLMPDRSVWSIAINAPAGFEVEPNSIAHAVAKQWQEFGIDARVVEMPPEAFFESATRGLFSAGAYWAGSCAMGPDLLEELGDWHSRYVVPLGGKSSYNRDRFVDAALDDFLDRLTEVPPDSNEAAALGIKVLQEFVTQLPSIQMFGTTQILPYSTHYWTNMPTDSNPYGIPWSWWANFKFLLPQLKQVGAPVKNSSAR